MAPKNRKQTNKKPKNTAFFFAKKKKQAIKVVHYWTHFLSRCLLGNPKNKKASRRGCQQPSKDAKSLCRCQNLNHRKSGPVGRAHEKMDTRRIPNSCSAAELDQGRYPWGGQQNTWRTHPSRAWNNVTKQQTAGQQLLGNTGLGR